MPLPTVSTDAERIEGDLQRLRQIDESVQPMWVYRFMRDGEHREVHSAATDEFQPHELARRLAEEIHGPVAFTLAIVTGCYDWLWGQDGTHAPVWRVIWPYDARTDKGPWRVESCPNGGWH